MLYGKIVDILTDNAQLSAEVTSALFKLSLLSVGF